MPPGMWKIFNHGQIHGLVHIIIIFSPHPHKVRDAVRDLRRFFVSIFLLLFFIAIQSYTIFFWYPAWKGLFFPLYFENVGKSTAQPSSFRRQGRARFRGAKHLFFVCMKLLESDSRCHIMNHMLLRALPSRPVRLVRSCSWRRRPTQGLRL